jgi:hypothetical protein
MPVYVVYMRLRVPFIIIITITSIAGKMLSGEKIKQILYSVIEETGKKIIQVDVSSNIESSQKYIDIIMSRFVRNHDSDIMFAILGEALLHFMLTISTLPSERKIEIKDGLTLDVVIPSLRSLSRDPNKSIIIQVIKDKKIDINKVEKLEFLQPNIQNIWLISTRPLSIAKYTDYSMFPNYGSHKYSNIITDIDKFLKVIKDKR